MYVHMHASIHTSRSINPCLGTIHDTYVYITYNKVLEVCVERLRTTDILQVLPTTAATHTGPTLLYRKAELH